MEFYEKVRAHRSTREFDLYAKNNELWSAIDQRDAKWLHAIIQSVPVEDRARVVENSYIPTKYRMPITRGTLRSDVPLVEACAVGWVDGVQLILDASAAQLNHRDMHRKTPLHIASERGHLDVVHLLLNRGAILDNDGRCLESAIYNGHVPVMTFFLHLRPDLVHIRINGYNMLGIAAISSSTEVLNVAISMMAPPYVGEIYYHPLYLAMGKFKYHHAVMLIRAGYFEDHIQMEMLEASLRRDVVDLRFADLFFAYLGLDNPYVDDNARICIRRHVHFDWSLTARLLGCYF